MEQFVQSPSYKLTALFAYVVFLLLNLLLHLNVIGTMNDALKIPHLMN